MSRDKCLGGVPECTRKTISANYLLNSII